MSLAFGATTTAEEVIANLGVSLDGKNIFVTGASSGIGVECARVFAKAGANVWLAGRNIAKTQAVADQIAQECGDASRVHVIELDLSDISSVRRCVDEFLSLNIPLHILLNNAGCMAVQQREETKDGFEMQIGTNHLGNNRYLIITFCLC
jgi:NAD(P)-dependent dehydrogenase (short-subunit alcohol dehydrogenase family)